MNVLGLHLLLDLRECNPSLLDNLNHIRLAMLRAAQDAGAHVIGESFHQFSPQGVTGILAIAESHITIHTWPEYGYAAADIFTCGSAFQARKVAGILVDELECRDPVITEVTRGLLHQTAVS